MLKPTPYDWPQVNEIEARRFLCGPEYQEGQLSLTVAAGGTGKTTLCVTEAVAISGGFSLFQNEIPNVKVWLISAEEDKNEIDRRIAAACQLGHGSRSENLFVSCITRNEIQIFGSEGPNENLIIELIKNIVDNDIKVLIVDPFICTHSVSENDNVKIDKVARAWRDIAQRGRCAVHLIHHQAKAGQARGGRNKGAQSSGSADAARGASALRDAARYVRTLEPHVPQEGEREKYGLKKTGGRYVLVSAVKTNYVAPGPNFLIELVEHQLNNGPVVDGAHSPGDLVGGIAIYPHKIRIDNSSKYNLNKKSAPHSSMSHRRQHSLKQDEINTIIRICEDNYYKKGNDKWIGDAIASALGINASENRIWINQQIALMIKRGELIEWKDTRPKNHGGKRATFLKPPGFTPPD